MVPGRGVGWDNRSCRCLRDEEVEETVFGGELGAVFYFVELFFAHHVDGVLEQIANHGLDVAANIANLGELAGLNLEKRAAGEFGESSRDLCLTNACRADHEDVLRHDLFGEVGCELLAARAVAQRDGDGALGRGLADDVLVELRRRSRAASFRRALRVGLRRCRVGRWPWRAFWVTRARSRSSAARRMTTLRGSLR